MKTKALGWVPSLNTPSAVYFNGVRHVSSARGFLRLVMTTVRAYVSHRRVLPFS